MIRAKPYLEQKPPHESWWPVATSSDTRYINLFIQTFEFGRNIMWLSVINGKFPASNVLRRENAMLGITTIGLDHKSKASGEDARWARSGPQPKSSPTAPTYRHI